MNDEQKQDLNALAGEYVLGTLDVVERRDIERRLSIDPDLAMAVSEWQRRFDPLLDDVTPVTPPRGVLDAVLKKINKSSATQIIDITQKLQRHVKTWRMAALGAGAIAAALALFIVRGELEPRPETNFVSVLDAANGEPAYVAIVDVKRKVIGLRRITSEPKPGSSYELWALGGGRDKPVSLGVIDAVSQISPKIFEQEMDRLSETTFAISLEPEGGSPTGQPTGAVLFTGKLLPVSKP